MKKSELRQLIREALNKVSTTEGALTNGYTFRVSGNVTINSAYGAANSAEAEDIVYEKIQNIFDQDGEIDVDLKSNMNEGFQGDKHTINKNISDKLYQIISLNVPQLAVEYSPSSFFDLIKNNLK